MVVSAEDFCPAALAGSGASKAGQGWGLHWFWLRNHHLEPTSRDAILMIVSRRKVAAAVGLSEESQLRCEEGATDHEFNYWMSLLLMKYTSKGSSFIQYA